MVSHFYQSKTSLPPPLLTCANCSARKGCVTASSLIHVTKKDPEKLREIVLRTIYRTQVENEAMLLGREAHEKLEAGRHVDKDPSSIIRRILNGETFFFTQSFCSVIYGLRAIPDAILASTEGDLLKLRIIEDKTHDEGRFWKQIWAMGMILSDINCLHTAPYIHGQEGMAKERKLFYPQLQEKYQQLEVWVCINPYKLADGGYRDAPKRLGLFSRGFVFELQFPVFAVKGAKKTLLEALYRPQILAAGQQTKFHMKTGEIYLPGEGKVTR